MILTDTFIEIGDQHKVCQDYIIQGDTPYPYLILADGCSSSKNSEIGAMVLCHLAKQYLKYRKDDLRNETFYSKAGDWIIHNAEMTIRQLGLSISSLYSTLIIAISFETYVEIHFYGDGFVVLKNQNETIIKEINFSNNAPYYLSYKVDSKSNSIYESTKNEILLSSYSNNKHIENLVHHFPHNYNLSLAFSHFNFESILISTDGLGSFITKDPTNSVVHKPLDLIDGFINFKNTKGEFLKRRVGKYIKELNKQNIVHADDIAMGCFLKTEE